MAATRPASAKCIVGATPIALGGDEAFAVVDPLVIGAMRHAVKFRTGSSTSRFRACLREEIASRLTLLNGSPPPEAAEYKAKCMRAFVTHAGAVTTRMALLALLPNGEWRSHKVEYYRSPSTGLVDAQVVLQYVSDGLFTAFASSQPHIYNRSKWTGSDLAVDDLGIFESVHRLLSTTYARFVASFLKGGPKAMMLQAGLSLAYYDALWGGTPAAEGDEGAQYLVRSWRAQWCQ